MVLPLRKNRNSSGTNFFFRCQLKSLIAPDMSNACTEADENYPKQTPFKTMYYSFATGA